jgi:hypothetical protein
VVLDKVQRASLDGKARGMCWKLTETLEDLDYADDICLLSHSQAHMQSKLNNLCCESKKAGLKINFFKTEEPQEVLLEEFYRSWCSETVRVACVRMFQEFLAVFNCSVLTSGVQ